MSGASQPVLWHTRAHKPFALKMFLARNAVLYQMEWEIQIGLDFLSTDNTDSFLVNLRNPRNLWKNLVGDSVAG